MIHNTMHKYWHDEWDRVLIQYPLATTSMKPAQQVERWDLAAKTYGVQLGMNNERVWDVMEMIKSMHLLNRNSLVLDIGCGTGAYAIPFSSVAGFVDALDFSPEMLSILAQQIESSGIDNIRLFEERFDVFAERATREKKQYDLVFTSLNPGLYNGESIMAMTALCRGYCIYIAAKRITTQSEKDLDPVILNVDCTILKGSNVIYPFNMLYTMGYDPQMLYTSYYSERTETKEVAVDRLVQNYKEKCVRTAGLEDTVTRYVEEHLTQNLFVEKTSGVLGVLIWKVPMLPI